MSEITLRGDALLFDMDGTVVDSTAVVEDVWRRYAAAEGLDLGELLAFSHGRQTPDTLRRFSPHLTPEEMEATRARLEHDDDAALALIVEVPGARRLLESLDAVPWAIVTSARRGMALGRIAAAGLPAAPVLVPADEIDRGKPDPDGYERAARALGVDSAQCVVFEDAGAGIEAGLACGAQVVVVGSLSSEQAQGLPRVPDLTGVRVRRDGDDVVVTLG